MDARSTVLGLVEMVDWNINFGNWLTIFAIAAGWGATVVKMNSDVKDIKAQMKSVASLVTNHAVFDNRLENLEEDVRNCERSINELRHGEGFIRSGRRGIDGEYP